MGAKSETFAQHHNDICYTEDFVERVTSITDPKGDKITYEYDEFNRLKQVKDKNGNILSENQYNYKP
jgi:YD repeat-containing protein